MIMTREKQLEEMVKELPQKARQEAKDYISYLLNRCQKSTENQKTKFDFSSLRGLALKSPPNPQPRFKNEDELS